MVTRSGLLSKRPPDSFVGWAWRALGGDSRPSARPGNGGNGTRSTTRPFLAGFVKGLAGNGLCRAVKASRPVSDIFNRREFRRSCYPSRALRNMTRTFVSKCWQRAERARALLCGLLPERALEGCHNRVEAEGFNQEVVRAMPGGKVSRPARTKRFCKSGKKRVSYKMSLTSQPLCYDVDRATRINRMASCFSARLPIQKPEDALLPLGLAQTWGNPISPAT